MAVYKGHRDATGAPVVTKDGQPFDPGPSQKLWNHSPDGFNWGYGGSGPAQLALALLLDATDDGKTAVIMHQEFKWEMIARLGTVWMMKSGFIQEWTQRKLGAKVDAMERAHKLQEEADGNKDQGQAQGEAHQD